MAGFLIQTDLPSGQTRYQRHKPYMKLENYLFARIQTEKEIQTNRKQTKNKKTHNI